jgi:hypothetical protein
MKINNGEQNPNFRHGHHVNGTPSPTYRSWQAMRQRCLNPNAASYDDYGGRGIKVCKRWLHSFDNFIEDMGLRPAGTSIDRYPNKNGDYKKSNCRWATRSQQSSNRRDCGPKVSAAKTGYKYPPEFGAKITARQTGRKLTPEWRARIGAAQLGSKRSPETRAKMSAAQTGTKKPWVGMMNKTRATTVQNA